MHKRKIRKLPRPKNWNMHWKPGFKHPALYFDLGYLRAKGDRLESAIRNLAHAVKHNDYGLGARLLAW